jgi:ATP-binding cassette subfamily B protein
VQPDNADRPGARPLPEVKGLIEMENVRFDYPDGTVVLKGVNLTVHPGESVAIVGPSGQGKTTLLNLILRFYHPSGGRIKVDGIDVADLRIGDLTKRTGTVLQDTHLFIGTIRENLRYAWPLSTDQDVYEAAGLADIEEFILSLPDGYDTDVREGMRMSGGQRQRLGIARALVGRPNLMLFDEPTSNLDSRTEAEVWTAMRNAMRGRTSLIVTHRLPTARNADRIAVLDDGRIVETGTHDELMERGGIYARMWKQQFRDGTAEAGP